MIKSQKSNRIRLEDYCRIHEDRSRRNRLVKWIKETGALVTIDGKKYIDFPKFDDSTLKAQDNERDRIRADSDFHSASWHVAKAFDLLDTRYEYMDRIRDKYLRSKKADSTDLKRQFKVVSSKFGELADRLIQAYELFFSTEPSKVEISDARGSFDEEQYYL